MSLLYSSSPSRWAIRSSQQTHTPAADVRSLLTSPVIARPDASLRHRKSHGLLRGTEVVNGTRSMVRGSWQAPVSKTYV